jgi:hypothetical protein
VTTLMNALKTSSRAAVIALALGASALTAMPAQAAPGEPSFNFQLGIGGGGGNSFDLQLDSNGKKKPGKFPINICLSDSQIERGLRDYGFRNVDVIRHLSKNRVQALGDWNRKTYIMTVNKCSGQVTDIKRVYRHGGGNGFGFSFSFGN